MHWLLLLGSRGAAIRYVRIPVDRALAHLPYGDACGMELTRGRRERSNLPSSCLAVVLRSTPSANVRSSPPLVLSRVCLGTAGPLNSVGFPSPGPTPVKAAAMSVTMRPGVGAVWMRETQKRVNVHSLTQRALDASPREAPNWGRTNVQ